jgi:alginate O-acetyltransferase complex protein AlgI
VGNKVSKLKWIRNILIVWTITGLWHGANYNFVLWGLYFAILLILEKLFLQKILDKIPKVFSHIYLIVIILFSWVIFRSESLIEVANTIKSMLGFNGLVNLELFYYTGIINIRTILFFILGILLSTPILEKIKIKNNYIKDIILLVILILSVVSILTSSYNPFIYFRF